MRRHLSGGGVCECKIMERTVRRHLLGARITPLGEGSMHRVCVGVGGCWCRVVKGGLVVMAGDLLGERGDLRVQRALRRPLEHVLRVDQLAAHLRSRRR